MKVLNNQKGFTLIELIIVIVVLGILAAVAIPQYVNMQADAQAAGNLGYVAGLRSTLSMQFAGQRLGRNPACVNATGAFVSVAPNTSPNATGANVQACVTGSLPSTLVLAAGPPSTWTGLAPLLSGATPTSVVWTLTPGATANDPITIVCGSTATNQC